MGAACGAESIPDQMKDPVVNCDTQEGYQSRPEFLRAGTIPNLVKSLLDFAPGV
jgi:hypothetical protein